MGMFDNITCKYPLPVEGFADRVFQTQDTPRQFLDTYEIREDGTLWHEEYDLDFTNAGNISRINKQMVPESFTGEIRFYDFMTGNYTDDGWIEFAANFIDGKLTNIRVVENRPSTP